MMKRSRLFTSHLMAIIAFSVCASLSSAQTKMAQPCQSKEPPALRGFFLGQTVDEIDLIIPNFREAFVKSEPINPIDKQVGATFVDSIPLFYKQPGVRQVPSKEFEDADFFWHFFEGRLYFLVVKYTEFEPPNLQYFIKQVSEKTNLPLNGWVLQDKYHASMKCIGFKIELWTGRDIGRPEYQDYPTIYLTDVVAEAEIKRRRDAIEQRKKNEERERIRREREKS